MLVIGRIDAKYSGVYVSRCVKGVPYSPLVRLDKSRDRVRRDERVLIADSLRQFIERASERCRVGEGGKAQRQCTSRTIHYK